MLKSRSVFPPGGWQFFETKTGWPSSQAAFLGLDFNQVVAAIVKHRLANPRWHSQWSTDPNDVGDELDEYTCVRIARDPNYCHGGQPQSFPGGAVTRPQSSLRQTFQPVRNAVAAATNQVIQKVGNAYHETKKVVAGIGLFKDWIGDAMKPVGKELAEARALVCADCPQNVQATLTSIFTVPASEMIRKQMAIREDMALATTSDEKLGICKSCACPMKLKVWTPIEHIRNHLLPEAKAGLDPRCWIPKE